MFVSNLSRRRVLTAGAFTLVGLSSLKRLVAQEDQNLTDAGAEEKGSNTTREQLIRRYYSGWEKKEWALIDGVLADNFTFTSPNDDDHITKTAYKARCWGQAEFVKRFELESLAVKADDAFVKGACWTTKGTSFRNVDYFRFTGEKISAIECYFGGHLGYPTASISGKA
jgi:SnoaL-like protein